MALTAGTTLGPYEIEAPLGAGGMGEVYRARDTRLDRTVAIKVLPEHVAADAALKQRFDVYVPDLRNHGNSPHADSMRWPELIADVLLHLEEHGLDRVLLIGHSLGGMLARAVLGDVLLQEGASANEALPKLFIELFPTWLAALIGVGVLAAIMSTADGLVIAASQIIANDIYRSLSIDEGVIKIRILCARMVTPNV